MPQTKFLKVATAGRTVDGREITAAQIDQMAETYDPKRYGARVWMEHFRSFLPDNPFKAYGDVLALKADTDSAGNRVLLAQVDATADLVKVNSDRQKVYWSIEMDPNFAGTGKAYMVGLGITDSPASLGTEMLKFALQAGQAPEQAKAHLFSAHVESPLEIEEAPKDPGPTLLTKVKEMLAGKGKSDEARFAQLEQAVTALAESMAGLKPDGRDFASQSDLKTLSDQVTALTKSLADLTTKLGGTFAAPERPAASGAGAANQTDC